MLGSPGGSTIITTVANDLISILDNGLDVQAPPTRRVSTINSCRTFSRWKSAFPHADDRRSRPRGYLIKREAEFDEKSEGVWGDSELIAVDPKTGELLGGQDHRHHFGKAAGF